MTKDLANLARALRARDICNEEIEKYNYVIDSMDESDSLNTLIVARNKWLMAKEKVQKRIKDLESS